MAAGTLSSRELVESCIARRDELDPVVNAMVIRCDERAREEAAAADDAHARGESQGPLHGLPVAIKDLQPTAGVRTTFGSPAFADNVPDTDTEIVARIRAAGGIVIGKTNIPERSIGANTVNPLFGATGNPFDPTRTCGGSSGGSGVALATQMAPLATGSDHGGSIRIPACYSGVAGHRATPGLVPHELRAVTQTFYSVQGPMARTVDDVALLLSVMAGRSPKDPMSIPIDAARFAQLDEVDASTLRVGVSEDLGGVLVSRSIRRTFRDRVNHISSLVRDVVEVPVDLRRAPDVDWKVRSDIFVAQYHREAETWGPDFNPNIRQSYQSALTTSMEDIARARRVQMELYQEFQSIFGDVDVLLCPGVSVSPFPWTERNPSEIDGAPVENYMAWLALSSSLTVVGHPVTAVPCGLDENSLPFGLQVVGPAFGDHRLLSNAAALEAAFATIPQTSRPEPDGAWLRTQQPNCQAAKF